MKNRSSIVIVIMSVVLLILLTTYGISNKNRISISVFSGRLVEVDETTKKYCAVIDAGHGGNDPGKVAANGVLEKDLNLEIAFKLKKFLEAQDIEVILTRDSDEGLYSPDTTNKKVEDMKRRLVIIEDAKADIVISIHQNSYQQAGVHGAQVFYHTSSKAGKKLAETIQNRMIAGVDPTNKREAKGNDNYYLLKKTTVPIAIVECGFLTNAIEAEKLMDDYYQEKIAWAIHLGVLTYLNTNL